MDYNSVHVTTNSTRPSYHRWWGAGITDRGRVRQSNQDAFLVLNDQSIWLVADGMGGHAGGDVASRIAVESIASALSKQDLIRAGWHNQNERERLLYQVIQEANGAIRREAHTRPELIGMGTTLVVLAIAEDPQLQATIAHVGDSRAYLVRGRALIQFTRDHTLVEEAVREGYLTVEEALAHPYRHVLSRAMGIETEVEPDISTSPLQPDDFFLLCTDGLTKMLDDNRILEVLLHSRQSPDLACRALVKEANRAGGEDNITAG
ncbi:MAG: Stp1/IreP family PP2C-type Ser/Thr phosphatase, partial [Nitrospiraceae bacterium]